MKHFIIKPLEWVEPNVKEVDDGFELAWKAQGLDGYTYAVTRSVPEGYFEAWIDKDLEDMSNLFEPEFTKHETVADAKSACESHHRTVAESLLESIGQVDPEIETQIEELRETLKYRCEQIEELRGRAEAAEEYIRSH